MSERQIIEIDLFTSRESIDLPLAEAVKRLAGLMESVPPEFRDTAQLSVKLEYDYDGPTQLLIEAFYSRKETEAEAVEREADEERRKESHKRQEIARLRSNLARLEGATRPD